VFILPVGNINALLKLGYVRVLVNKGELDANGTVKVVEEVAPTLKNLCLILVLRKLIVYILERNGFIEKPIIHTANPIPVHFSVWYGLLRGGRFLPAAKQPR